LNILIVLPRIYKNIYEPEHFPVGIAYVSSALKKAGYTVDILNLNFLDGSVYDNLSKVLRQKKYDIVETGGITINYKLIKEIIDNVKKIDINTYTLIGGGIITSSPEVVMNGISNADFGVIGEGEITNVELIEALIQKSPLESVDGLIFRKNVNEKTVLIRNRSRSEIDNLDDLPWPDYDGFELEIMLKYAPKNYLTMSTGRSCIYNCTFCFHTSGKVYRQRSLDSFFNELEYVVEKYRIDNIYVTDELFAYDSKRLDEFCARIKKYHILWAVQLRVDIINENLLKKLKDSGCIILSLGIESADDKILKSMKKNITINQIENALECCKNVGIQSNGSFIFGDIEETIDSANKTINWWEKHRQYNINLEMIQIFPGTELYNYAIKNNIISDELKFIEDGCPYINVSKMTDEEYRQLAIRIDKIQADAEILLQDIVITRKDLRQRKIDIEGICGHCATKLKIQNVHAVKITNHQCAYCGSKNMLTPVVMFSDNIRHNLVEALNENKVVFYQATKYYSDLLKYYSDLIEGCLVVDDRFIKQGEKIGNITVKSPDQISDENLCIICDYIYDGTYKNKALSANRRIKKAIGIWELIQPI